MYDGSGWTFFGIAETGGLLSGWVNAFAESSTGAIWVLQGNTNVVVYEDGVWSSLAGIPSLGTPVLFDRRDNLWYNDQWAARALGWC